MAVVVVVVLIVALTLVVVLVSTSTTSSSGDGGGGTIQEGTWQMTQAPFSWKHGDASRSAAVSVLRKTSVASSSPKRKPGNL